METHDSVDAMVNSYAERAVAAARDLETRLDYSENSIRTLDEILARVVRQSTAKLTSDDVSELCKMWGSYLGEVVRRRYGGEWSIQTYPGRQFATLTLSIGGHRLFPTMKVHRRLTEGESENLWSFYQMVKSRLEAVPGGSIQ